MNEHCEEILGPDPDREEWLKLRRTGVGSSDASAIAGVSAYESPYSVWLDKTSAHVDVGRPSIAARHGNHNEPFVAELFTEATGLSVSRVGLLRSKAWPWMIASCDYLVDSQEAILECKTTNVYSSKEWDGDEVPDHALIQVIHQMAVTGLKRAYVAVLIGNNDLQIRVVERDETAIKGLVELTQNFWENTVICDHEPDASSPSDLPKIKERVTPLEGVEVVATPVVEMLLGKRAFLSKQIREMQREEDVLTGRIIQQLEGASAVTSINGDVICTYREMERKSYTVEAKSFRQLKLTTRGKEYVNG